MDYQGTLWAIIKGRVFSNTRKEKRFKLDESAPRYAKDVVTGPGIGQLYVLAGKKSKKLKAGYKIYNKLNQSKWLSILKRGESISVGLNGSLHIVRRSGNLCKE